MLCTMGIAVSHQDCDLHTLSVSVVFIHIQTYTLSVIKVNTQITNTHETLYPTYAASFNSEIMEMT